MFVSMIIMLAFVFIVKIVDALIDCDNVLLSETNFNGMCNNKWLNLKNLVRPMQREVGYAWVQHKLVSAFDSSKNAQKEMDDTVIPAVVGPDDAFYIVDHHHELAALDFSGYSSTVVTVQVLCDYRNSTMDEFWDAMVKTQYVYLAAHPELDTYQMPAPITPDQLSGSFSFTEDCKTFADDPWRSLASFSRKVNMEESDETCDDNSDFCMRCFYRGCETGDMSSGPGVPFFEYRWSYFMLYASMYDVSFWPSIEEHDKFLSTYNSTFTSSTHFGSYDLDDWLDTASLVVPLCRAKATGMYTLPQEIFAGEEAATLPGYVEGYEALPQDPDCDSPKSCL